jgi:hypothetical protein
MRIGIIGTGNMGRALGLAWAAAGHEVLFGSRDLDKARATASHGSATTRGGDFAAAAEFGEVVLYTVRDVLPSRLLGTADALRGKVVVDCNNRHVGDDRDPSRFRFDSVPPLDAPSMRLAADVPHARVVKAFNGLPAPVLALAPDVLAPQRVSCFLCGDDAAAKDAVAELARAIGLVPIDSGPLALAWMLDAVADFVRMQIGNMGRGMFTALSLVAVSQQRGAA